MKKNIKSFSPYELWRLDEYKKNYISNIIIENNKLKNALQKKDITHWKYSAVNRYHMMISLCYRTAIDTAETITVLYKIKDIQQPDHEVIYNMAYVQIKPKNKNVLYIDILEKMYKTQLSISDNIYIQQICPAGSMLSKDGEYRSGIINWNSTQLILSQNPEIKELFNYILEYFTDALKERKYVLLTEYYFPTDKIKNRYQFETELLCTNTKIHFFCIAWFNFYYSYYFGFISNHINDIFKTLMLKYKKDDIEFFKSLWVKFSIERVDELRYILGNNLKAYSTKYKHYDKMKLGQKIIPLNLIEAQRFFNIEYTPWKEFFINQKLSDLVVNNISNGFSLSGVWFLIKNSDKFFFDNPTQSKRLEKSRVALKIAEILTQAKIYTYHNIDNEKELDKNIDMFLYNIINSDRNSEENISDDFKDLYDHIMESITHAKENIIMSNVSLCLVTEFLGKTLYDAIFLSRRSSYYKNLVKNIFSQDSHKDFRKYMFQLCYNLYCINSKLNIIHGDLHLNNITLNSIFYKKNMNIDIEDPQILYILDEKTQFMFEHNFYDLCLIDFSRAIFNPENIEFFKMDNIPYDIINSENSFLEKQVKNLLEYLYNSKPEYKEYGATIENSIKHHFNEYFKILTVLDLYNLTSRFIDFLKSEYKDVKNPARESINLIHEMNKSADYFISSVLNKLINERNYEEVNNMEWPMFTIIKDVFSLDNALNNDNYDNIADVYNFNNNIEFSLSELKKLPPVLKSRKKMVDGKIINATAEENKLREISMKRRKLYENKTFDNFKIVNIIQERHKEKNI